jgi:hypothetical protein
MAVAVTEKQRGMLARMLSGVRGSQVDLPDGPAQAGAKELGDALQLLEEQIEGGALSPQDLRTAESLARTLRQRFLDEGAEIGYRSDIETMVAETKNDIFGNPNCDLAAML